MAVDSTKLIFFSGANYMKRSNFSSNTSITLGAYGAVSSFVITHNLGYIPFYQAVCDIDNNGTLWTPYELDQYIDTSAGVDPAVPDFTSWVTTTTLTLNLTNLTSPVATGSRTIYWIIYKDYNV